MTAALPEPAALQAMLDAATEGPWKQVVNRHGSLSLISAPDADGYTRKVALINNTNIANADLIAVAPQLAAQRIADAAEIERLRAALEEIADQVLRGEAGKFDYVLDAFADWESGYEGCVKAARAALGRKS